MLVDADRLGAEQWEHEQRLRRPWKRATRATLGGGSGAGGRS